MIDILPLSILFASVWMAFEFIGMCHAHRKFRRLRETVEAENIRN